MDLKKIKKKIGKIQKTLLNHIKVFRIIYNRKKKEEKKRKMYKTLLRWSGLSKKYNITKKNKKACKNCHTEEMQLEKFKKIVNVLTTS
jgi:hypothetical protein